MKNHVVNFYLLPEQIWVNREGQLVIDSRLKDLPNELLCLIEDCIYEEDGEEKIDWWLVENEYFNGRDDKV